MHVLDSTTHYLGKNPIPPKAYVTKLGSPLNRGEMQTLQQDPLQFQKTYNTVLDGNF